MSVQLCQCKICKTQFKLTALVCIQTLDWIQRCEEHAWEYSSMYCWIFFYLRAESYTTFQEWCSWANGVLAASWDGDGVYLWRLSKVALLWLPQCYKVDYDRAMSNRSLSQTLLFKLQGKFGKQFVIRGPDTCACGKRVSVHTVQQTTSGLSLKSMCPV